MPILQFPHAATLVLAFGLTLLPAQPARAAEQQVDAYNTYLFPPFLTADGGGLAAELVGRLNAQLSGLYRLRLHHIPRQRLMLTELRDPAAFDGVGLLLSPAFVNEQKPQRLLWSNPIFQDYNVLIFTGPAAPPIATAADLKGKRFGAILGNRYQYVDELIASGSIVRHDTTGERLNLRKVASGRIDFTQMNRLLYHSMAAEPEFAGRLAAIPEPDTPPFTRRLFVGPRHAELMDKLNEALASLPCDGKWRATANLYGIALAPCALR